VEWTSCGRGDDEHFSPDNWLQLGTSTTTISVSDKRGVTIGCLKIHNNARSALRSYDPRGNVIAGRHPRLQHGRTQRRSILDQAIDTGRAEVFGHRERSRGLTALRSS